MSRRVPSRLRGDGCGDARAGQNGAAQPWEASGQTNNTQAAIQADLHQQISRYADSVGMHEWSIAMQFFDMQDVQQQLQRAHTRTGGAMGKEEFQILVVEREGHHMHIAATYM